MSDLPERIWATGDSVNGSWTSQEIPPKWGANAVEYVPAVTVQAQIDAAVKAALREAAAMVETGAMHGGEDTQILLDVRDTILALIRKGDQP